MSGEYSDIVRPLVQVFDADSSYTSEHFRDSATGGSRGIILRRWNPVEPDVLLCPASSSTSYTSIAMTAFRKSHYHVLGLTGSATTSYGLEDIKAAYKRALLRHHPDKARENAVVSQISVDDITRAFKLLSDPILRAAYDREQALLQTRQQQKPWPDGNAEREGSGLNTGLETVDLDDMTLREQDGSEQESEMDVWTRQCRCGRHYTVSEAQLEAELARGEIYLPCDGCSLWLRVLYQAAEA